MRSARMNPLFLRAEHGQDLWTFRRQAVKVVTMAGVTLILVGQLDFPLVFQGNNWSMRALPISSAARITSAILSRCTTPLMTRAPSILAAAFFTFASSELFTLRSREDR